MEWPRHDKLGDHLTQLHSSAMADPVFAGALAEASAFLVQRSPTYQLDSPNLVARTEYHSRLVLSTLILRFFSQNRCTAGISALFLHSAQRKPPCFGRKPTCFLLHFKVVLAIIITQDFVGRFSFLSTPCSRGCCNRQFKTVLPPESRHTERLFKGSLVRKR